MRGNNTLAVCVALALSVAVPTSFAQQEWPVKPVRIVVPSAAGSAQTSWHDCLQQGCIGAWASR